MTFADFQALQDIKDAKAAAERQKEREREREERKQDMANLLQQHTNFSLQPIARTVLTLKRSHTTPTESDEDSELKADDHDGEDAMDQDRDDDHE
jgi:predicted secreted protein